jgi:hypothetical protein
MKRRCRSHPRPCPALRSAVGYDVACIGDLDLCHRRERVDTGVVRTAGKVLWFSCLPVAGAAAGYACLVGVLRPLPAAVACPLWQLRGPGCASYQIIASKPFFLVAGALAGGWLAWAAARLFLAGGQPGLTRGEAVVAAPLLLGLTAWIVALHPGLTWEGWGGWGGLSWSEQVLLFVLAAVLVRLAIGVASFADVRGGLLLAFGAPVIFAGLGYAVITIFRQPPVGHSCPAVSPACSYYPLIGEAGPWIFLGLLAGVWLAYATAAGLAGSPRRGRRWVECAIVLPVMTAVIVWALAFSHQQAGGGYAGLAGLFVAAVCLAALLRLLLGARPVRKQIPGLLSRLGMVSRTGAAAHP